MSSEMKNHRNKRCTLVVCSLYSRTRKPIEVANRTNAVCKKWISRECPLIAPLFPGVVLFEFKPVLELEFEVGDGSEEVIILDGVVVGEERGVD
jgi:hypothetical protein